MMSSRLRPTGLLAAFVCGRRTLLAAFAGVALLATAAASAQTTSFTETVLATNTFTNAADPFAGNAQCSLQTGTHTFAARTIEATVTGSYTFTMSAATGLGSAAGTGTDPWAAIFSGAFNPAAPTAGLINCDDDTVNGSVRTPTLTVNLVAGQRYTLVTSNWQTGIHPGTATYQVTAPIVLAGAPVPLVSVTNIGFDQAELNVQNPEDGDVYYTLQLASAAAPSSAQVQAGQDGSGGPVVAAGFNAGAGTVFQTVGGLQPGTLYRAYAVVRDRQTPPQLTATPASAEFTTLSDLADPPPAVTAAITANVGEATVSFTPPAYVGAGAVTQYTVTSAPDASWRTRCICARRSGSSSTLSA